MPTLMKLIVIAIVISLVSGLSALAGPPEPTPEDMLFTCVVVDSGMENTENLQRLNNEAGAVVIWTHVIGGEYYTDSCSLLPPEQQLPVFHDVAPYVLEFMRPYSPSSTYWSFPQYMYDFSFDGTTHHQRLYGASSTHDTAGHNCYWIPPHDFNSYRTHPWWGRLLHQDIIERVDDAFDFGPYDHDLDGYVDFTAFIDGCVYEYNYGPYGGGGWNGTGIEGHLTNDVNSNGDTVRIGQGASFMGPNGAVIMSWDIDLMNEFWRCIAITAHEYEHHIECGPIPGQHPIHAMQIRNIQGPGTCTAQPNCTTDHAINGIFGYDGRAGWTGGLYGNTFTPLFKSWWGWCNQIVIDEPDESLYDHQFTNVTNSGHLVKVIFNDTVGPGYEYFLLSQMGSGSGSVWDSMMPPDGLVIFHVDDNPMVFYNKYELHKVCDVECAEGLFTWGTATPNTVTGRDDLDMWHFTTPCWNVDSTWLYTYGGNRGEANDPFSTTILTQQDFDMTTNPSSAGYDGHLVGQNWQVWDCVDSMQNVYSGVAVRNIRNVDGDIIADVICGAVTGSITSNTTWGPGKINVQGDITVPAGVTLTINPGTTVRFFAGCDYEQGGRFANKCELIVDGTLDVNGTQGNEVVFKGDRWNGGAGQWGGIYVRTGGTVEADYLDLMHAVDGVAMWSDEDGPSVALVNSSISQCSGKGLTASDLLYSASISVSGCEFWNNANFDVYTSGVHSLMQITIVGTRFTSPSVTSAIYLSNLTTVRIDSCSISGDEIVRGVHVANTDVTMQYDTISIGLPSQIRTNAVFATGELTDLFLGHCILNSYVADEVRIEAVDTARVTYCKLSNFGNAAFSVSTNASLLGRYVKPTTYAGYNGVLSHGMYNVLYQGAGTLYAEQNWWQDTSATRFSSTGGGSTIDRWPMCDSASSWGSWGRPNGQSPLMVPDHLALHCPEPNPFNPSTTIAFDLPEASSVRLDVYNVLGQKVATLVNGSMTAGSHSVVWDASNVGSGVYFARLTTDLGSANTKMTLLK